MINIVKVEAREPQAAMGDAKEFVVFSSPGGAEPSGCQPGPCIQPPGPPVCQPCEKCRVCDAPPNPPPKPPNDRP